MTEDITESALDFVLGSFVGLLAWFFGGLDGYLKALIALSVIDYVSGTCAAFFKKQLSSSIGFNGILKKCVMITFVGVAHILDTLAGQVLDSGQMFRNSVCFFYIANEGLSIIENAVRLNIPVPNFLVDRLLKFKDENKHESQEKENIS